MDRKTLGGLHASLITPFDRSEEMDEAPFRELVRGLLGRVDAFVVSAAPGEFEYLTIEERKRLLETCVDEVGGRAPVIAGVGTPGTRLAKELADHAEGAGAEACLVSAPYFLQPSDKGVQQHFVEVVASTSLPVIVYNPKRGEDGRVPRVVLEDLCRIDGIIGLADASGDISYLMEVDEKTDGQLALMNANEEVALPALAAGVEGLMLGSAQIYPEQWRDLMTAVEMNDLSTARGIQRDLQKLSRIFTRYGGSVPLKAGLRYLDHPVGRSRGPLREGGVILHEDREEIKLELEKIGLLPPSVIPSDDPSVPLAARFEDVGIGKGDIASDGMMVGSSSHGSGLERAVVDLIMGPKSGLVGEAFASQFVYLRPGREALPSVLEPNLSTRPACLIVPTVELRNLRQANIMYGPAQSAIAKAIVDKVASGVLTRRMVDEQVILTKAYVNPNALDRATIYDNFYLATAGAIDMAMGGAR